MKTQDPAANVLDSEWREEDRKGLHRPMAGSRRRRIPSVRILAPVVLLCVVVLFAVFAPTLAPHDPGTLGTLDLNKRLLPPVFVSGGGWDNVLGTDALGRDVLSRLIYASRISLLVGVGAVVLAGALGVFLGLVAGFFGRWIDSLIGRLMDVQLALPTMILVIFMMAVLGSGTVNVILVLAIAGWVTYAKVVRAQVLVVRELEYVDAVRVLGLRKRRIILRHVLPNAIAPAIVVATFSMASAITAEAALSFLGMGVPPTTPTWGGMLSDGRNYMYQAWWLTVFPGVALMLTVLAINLLGDQLRDHLDPRLRGL